MLVSLDCIGRYVPLTLFSYMYMLLEMCNALAVQSTR